MPRNNEDTEKITLTIPSALLERIDKTAKETKMSRSGLAADLIEQGFRQTTITKKLLANKYILRAFQMVFNITPEEYENEKYRNNSNNEAVEAVRRTVLEELRKISVAEAEADINRDMGFDKQQA
jgi:hypothetical protein